jgi:hypothetical protein
MRVWRFDVATADVAGAGAVGTGAVGTGASGVGGLLVNALAKGSLTWRFGSVDVAAVAAAGAAAAMTGKTKGVVSAIALAAGKARLSTPPSP